MITRLKNFIYGRKKSGTPPGRTIWTVMSEVVAGNPVPAPTLALHAIDQLRELCPEPEDYLHRLLRMTALHRTVVLQKRLSQTVAPVVQGGPFAGMTLLPSSKEGCYLPKLLGCYESALHEEWRRVIRQRYSTIVNIGCADGYYAVGLARLMPNTRILAYDLSAEARESCRGLARLNGMEARIEVGGEFKGSDFAQLPGKGIFVICDIEGEERELLDPQQYPTLKHADILVEMHQTSSHKTDSLINKRFESTHHITIIDATLPAWPLPSVLKDCDELDKMLAVWEWRVQPTPWAILLSKEQHQSG